MSHSPYKHAAWVRQEHGAIMGEGMRQQASTVQCCHCGGHWTEVKGSGKRRGYCQKCHGKTCGNPLCDNCVPMEVALDYAERRKVQEKYAVLIKKYGHLIVGNQPSA
jgi:hypothetical protein